MSEKDISQSSIIRQGLSSPFWQIICKGIDDNIKAIEKETEDERMDELPAEEYKIMMEVLKMKKRYLLKLKDYPGFLLENSKQPVQTTPNYDPYNTASDFIDNK